MTPPFRIGIGYDIHSFEKGGKLVLGGIEIPSEMGLKGHSDADCLSHALADAILGTCGLPDIGHFFPNDALEYKGINSQIILKKALQLIEEQGYKIGNVDVMIIAETPKLAPHLKAMKGRIAESLKITEHCVGIKATTHEKIGALGAKAGIATHAACLVYKA